MSALLAAVALVAVAALLLLRSVITALVIQEVKGALADRLERSVGRAAERIPNAELRASMHAKWLAELGAAKDRPLTAVRLVRGFDKAARAIAAQHAIFRERSKLSQYWRAIQFEKRVRRERRRVLLAMYTSK